MGLFDGEPSSADLARRLGLPVLAVIDASAMAGTFGALAFGLQHFREGLPWAGVLANRVAGPGHAAMLQAALGDPAHWLGALARDEGIGLPERHLGLTSAGELPDALARLDLAADALSGTPLGQWDAAAWAARAVAFTPATTSSAPPPLLAGKRIAVARDAAFCFIYEANLDTLRQLGAELLFFSPLADESLPGCDAAWLPGGYPELHAARLSESHGTRESLRRHVQAGRPVWAECGGMMVLFDTLADSAGQAHAMWGLLPGRVAMQQRLAGLGPQQLALPGGVLRGHTFHYSRCDCTLQPALHTASPRPGGRAGEAVWGLDALRASYFHAWFASCPEAAASLFLASTDETTA